MLLHALTNTKGMDGNNTEMALTGMKPFEVPHPMDGVSNYGKFVGLSGEICD